MGFLNFYFFILRETVRAGGGAEGWKREGENLKESLR